MARLDVQTPYGVDLLKVQVVIVPMSYEARVRSSSSIFEARWQEGISSTESVGL
jgi:hypothetical protein